MKRETCILSISLYAIVINSACSPRSLISRARRCCGGGLRPTETFWEKYSRLSLAKVALRNPYQMQYKASFTFWIGFFYMLYPLFLKKLCKIDFFQNKKNRKRHFDYARYFRQSDVCQISEIFFL